MSSSLTLDLHNFLERVAQLAEEGEALSERVLNAPVIQMEGNTLRRIEIRLANVERALEALGWAMPDPDANGVMPSRTAARAVWISKDDRDG